MYSMQTAETSLDVFVNKEDSTLPWMLRQDFVFEFQLNRGVASKCCSLERLGLALTFDHHAVTKECTAEVSKLVPGLAKRRNDSLCKMNHLMPVVPDFLSRMLHVGDIVFDVNGYKHSDAMDHELQTALKIRLMIRRTTKEAFPTYHALCDKLLHETRVAFATCSGCNHVSVRLKSFLKHSEYGFASECKLFCGHIDSEVIPRQISTAHNHILSLAQDTRFPARWCAYLTVDSNDWYYHDNALHPSQLMLSGPRTYTVLRITAIGHLIIHRNGNIHPTTTDDCLMVSRAIHERLTPSTVLHDMASIRTLVAYLSCMIEGLPLCRTMLLVPTDTPLERPSYRWVRRIEPMRALDHNLDDGDVVRSHALSETCPSISQEQHRPLPPGWCAYLDPSSKRWYYHHTKLHVTQWTFPARRVSV